MDSSPSRFTYWSLLGLPPESSPDELKKAFKREAMRWHPDLNRNNQVAEERFKWVNEAYKVLSDPRKRFEWEVAGRPTFEIEEIPVEASKSNSNSSESKVQKNSTSFNSAEKLLLLLIAIFSLYFLNTFIS